jgi:hypothetical protein
MRDGEQKRRIDASREGHSDAALLEEGGAEAFELGVEPVH